MSDPTEGVRDVDAREIVRMAADATREWRRRVEGFNAVDVIMPGAAKDQAWLDVLELAKRLIKSGELLGDARARLELARVAAFDSGISKTLGRAQQQLLQAFERLLKIRVVEDASSRRELRVAVKLSRQEAGALLNSWKGSPMANAVQDQLDELAELQKRISNRLAHSDARSSGNPIMNLADQFGTAAATDGGLKPGLFNRRKNNRWLAERGRILLQPLAALHDWLVGQLLP